MTSKSSGRYIFRKHDSIGANAAENDEAFLKLCFEDTGDLDILLNPDRPERIILGRTGSGKSALLLKLQEKAETVIAIEPENLSLNYIANSTIIRFLHDLGVNLDPFYKLLWRHVLSVTLLQERFGITDEQAKRTFIDKLWESSERKRLRQIQADRKRKALAYIERWGESFWADAEYRTKEVTTRFETEVENSFKSSLGFNFEGKLPTITPKLSGGTERSGGDSTTLSLEERGEILARAQNVVNEIQVRELSGMFDLLEEALADSATRYYITIDRLDEAWVDDALRYRLIKALVDTVKEFGKVHRAKVIVSLRIDLIERVFRDTRSEAGFQEEKYRSLNLPLKWTRGQLISLLNKRIAQLMKDEYTSYQPSCEDILPQGLVKGRSGKAAVDYILERTWMRPRDVIDFFNACISKAEGKVTFSKDIILEAEGEYSRGRLRSLATEWHGLYPRLPEVIDRLLKKRTGTFVLAQIDDHSLDELCLNIVCDTADKDMIHKIAEDHVNNLRSHAQVRSELIAILYRVGAVGLKTESYLATRWADNESYSVSPSEIDDDCHISIHPALWRVLGVDGDPKP